MYSKSTKIYINELFTTPPLPIWIKTFWKLISTIDIKVLIFYFFQIYCFIVSIFIKRKHQWNITFSHYALKMFELLEWWWIFHINSWVSALLFLLVFTDWFSTTLYLTWDNFFLQSDSYSAELALDFNIPKEIYHKCVGINFLLQNIIFCIH